MTRRKGDWKTGEIGLRGDWMKRRKGDGEKVMSLRVYRKCFKIY